MNKKIIYLSFLAVFLILSVSMVCAEDDGTQNISVNLVWSDSNNLPESVTVELLKDGSVVDTKTLSAGNSWSATFTNQDLDGSYSVKVADNSDYTTSVSGDVNSGFKITGKTINNEKTSDNTNKNAEKTQEKSNFTSSANVLKQYLNSSNVSNSTDNSTNKTNDTSIENTTDENSTEKTNGTSIDNSTKKSNSTLIIDNTTKTKTVKAVTKVNEVVKEKHPLKKAAENKTVKHDLKNTGLPIALVVIALAVLIAVPMLRKK